MEAMRMTESGPASQPSCAVLHGRDSTPDPITPVTMCATAVHTVPFVHKVKFNQIQFITVTNKHQHVS